MKIRSGESGNIFFTLFGAIALVGVVGVATSTLMRGPVGTVLSMNQKAKIDAQLQIARKLVALEATDPPHNCEGSSETEYIEPLEPDVSAMPSGCDTLITGGGCLPQSVGAAKTDSWGTQIGYCGWNHGPDTSGCANLRTGLNSRKNTVLAVISAGPDRTFQTSCVDYDGVDADANGVADNPLVQTGGDDIVFEWTYDEAAEGLGGGLWALKSGDPDAITTTKDVEFASGTTAKFDDVTAQFGAGSRLDLGMGGLFNLPNESVLQNGDCNGANKGVLRRFTNQPANDQEVLQICDGSAWQSVTGAGGTAAGGANGEIQYNSGGTLDGDNALIWDATNNELGIGVNPNNTLDVAGTAQITGATQLDSTLNVTGAATLGSTLGVTGATSLSTLGTSGLATLSSAAVTTNATVGGTLGVTGAATLGSTLGVTGNTTVGGTLGVTGATTLGSTLGVVGATDLDSTLNVDGAAVLQSTLNGKGAADLDSTLNVDGATVLQTTLNAKGAVDFDSTLNVDGVMKLGANAQVEGGDCTGYTAGAVTFDGVNDELLLCSSVAGNKWVTVGTSGGGGGGAGATTVFERSGTVIRSKAPAIYATDDFVFGSTQLADDGDTDHDNRMFFDKSKGAFRAGSTTSTQWDDANVGLYSIGLGNSLTVSGWGSVGLGSSISVSGLRSLAAGSNTGASGDDAFAIGEYVAANAQYAVAMGTDAVVTGTNSMGLGLGTAAGVRPTVSGQKSFGVFMGDQSGVTFAANNTMALLGGRMVIDPAVPATQLAVSGVLDLDVEGQVGAIQYCDEAGANCFTAASVAGGTGAAPGNDREVVFNSGGALAAADTFKYFLNGDFIVGGPQLADDGNAAHDTRMFFDKSKGAFRAGTVDSTQWDDASVGVQSAAFGQNTIASGTASFAAGINSSATGHYSTVFGGSSAASGQGSFAAGEGVSATGTDSFALGSTAKAVGNRSAALGLGVAPGAQVTWPQVSAASSFGIFMGDQTGVDVATGNLMALLGGKLIIDPDTTSAANVVPSGTLVVDVQGQVGATEYCDENGANCFTAASAAGGAAAYGADGVIQFASAGGLWGDANFVFTSAGRLGIGTAAPSYELDVAGSAQVSGTLYLPVGGIPPNLSMAFATDTDTGFYNAGDGTFYIVSNGTALLQVHGDKIKLNSATAQIEAGFGTAANPTYSFDGDDNTGIYRAAADALGFSTAGTEKIRLTSGGALGIGDLTPDGTLLVDVAGQVGATEYCDENGANCFTAASAAAGAYGADGVIQFASAGGLWGDANFVFTSAGRLGIGTAAPVGALHVAAANDGIMIENTAGAANQKKFGMAVSGDLWQLTSYNDNNTARSSQIIVATGSGAVGIRDGSPDGTLQLDVEGQVGATEYCDENGANCFTATDIGAMAIDDLTDAYAEYTSAHNLIMGRAGAADLTAGAQYNTFLGENAGATTANSTAATDSNTAIGYVALTALTTGDQNTAVGRNAANHTTTGSYNTAVGNQALQGNDTGYGNTAIGSTALYSNVANRESTAVGYSAMFYANDTATGAVTYNTAVGAYALQGSATAANNTGTRNTAIGHSTLTNNTSGAQNVAIGYKALTLNTTGGANIAIGIDALGANLVSGSSTAIGHQALAGATSGENTAVGAASLIAVTTGIQNAALGVSAGAFIQSGSNNTAVGASALYGAGGNRLTGSQNTAVGGSAGLLLQGAAADNTFLGYNAGNTTTTGASNILIGSGVVAPLATTSNYLNIGDVLLGDLDTGGDPRIGSYKYCDENLNNCFTAASVAGGAAAYGADGVIQFASAGGLWGDANFVFTSAGRLGIGTAAPTDELHLRKDQVSMTNIVAENQSGGVAGAGLYAVSNSTYVGLEALSNNWGTMSRIFTQGDLGIAINGSYAMYFFHNSNGVSIGDYANTFVSPPNGGMIVSGNVGIGTAAPADKLHIYSTANAAGTGLTVDNQGASNAQQSWVNLMTLGDGTKLLPDAATKGWSMFGRGNAYATAAERNDLGFAYWNGASWISPLWMDSATGNVGIGTTTPTYKLSLDGEAAQTIGMERETTNASAGRNLTIQAGGGDAGSTDAAGGDLILSGGISTGTAGSRVTIRTAIPNTGSGSNDHTPMETAVFHNYGLQLEPNGNFGNVHVSFNGEIYDNGQLGYLTTDSAFLIQHDINNDIFGIYGAPSNTAGSTITYNNGITMNASGSVAINSTQTTLAAKFVVAPPASEVIAGAAVVTANACGTIKQVTAGGNVTTNTTDTFTAPTASYAGCCMDVVNVDAADTITLDSNAKFFTGDGSDVALAPGKSVRVCSDGTSWYQAAAVSSVASSGSSIDGLTDAFTDYVTQHNVIMGRAGAAALTAGAQYNTFLGEGAGATTANSTAATDSNTAVGYVALTALTTGDQNTAVGRNAANHTTTGSYNTAIGNQALQFNDTGSGNTAIGSTALYSNVANRESTAIGYSAMFYANDTATGAVTYNTAVGAYALQGSSTPGNNTGTSNTAVGHEALQDNTSGSDNIAMGYAALHNNASGNANVAIGYQAMNNNTSGLYNVAIGEAALLTNATKGFNVAIGHNAMANADSAAGGAWSANIAIGGNAMKGSGTAANNTGQYNTAIGYNAMTVMTSADNSVVIGLGAAAALTSGDNNVAIGYAAGDTLTSGGSNILIGYDADAPANNTSNFLNIGGTIYGDVSTDNVRIGGSGTVGAGPLIATPPATQTIAAGNVITANACGTSKMIDAGSSVTTDTTDTFTASTAAYTGCCMDVINVDAADTITLDQNAKFFTGSGADLALSPGKAVRVCSNGTAWYQAGGVSSLTSASVVLSGVTAATGDATIASGANNIAWNWKLTGAETGMSFGETTASTGGTIGASGNQFIVKAGALATSTATPLIVTNLGTANSFRVNDETSDADTTPFVIDASGNVGIGTATPVSRLHVKGGAANSSTDMFTIEAEGEPFLRITSADNSGNSQYLNPLIVTSRSRGTTAAPTIVQSGDTAFEFYMEGYDGSAMKHLAYISAVVDGTPGANDMPGRLEFHTQPDGSGASPEGTTPEMVIKNDGKVGIGTGSPGYLFSMASNVENGFGMKISSNNAMENPYMMTERSRGTNTAPTVVSSGDVVNEFIFNAYDGTNYESAAYIGVYIDGTPGNNDMPGRIEFHTQPDGNNAWLGDGTTAPEMVIKNDGSIGIGTATPNQGKMEVKGGTVCVDTNSDDNASSCIANESDMRLKKNVRDLDYSVETLMKLRPVQFDWKYDDPEILKHYPLISRFSARPHSIGFLAQDVQKLVPEAIESETVGDDEVQYFQLDYTKLVPVMVKAAQEQQGDITALQAENDRLKAELAKTQTTLAAVQDDIKGLKAYTGYGIGRAQAGFMMIGAAGGAALLVVAGGAFMRRRRASKNT